MPEFEGVLELRDGGVSFIRVPPAVAAELGPGRRPKVWAELNGHSYQTTLAVYSKESYLGVRREVREAAGVPFGGPVRVHVELDASPRVVAVPEALAVALAANPELRPGYERLSYTRKKEIAESISAAKTVGTQRRRLDRILATLKP